MAQIKKVLPLLFLSVILITAFWTYTKNNDFPIGFHADEIKKANFILGANPDFKHPTLIIKTVKIFNLFCGFDDVQAVVELGRTTTALYGIGILILCGLIIKKLTSNQFFALLGVFVLAFQPLLVSHAHFLKEDIALTFCIFLVVWRLLLYDASQKKTIYWLAISIGLAFSSHYKSALLVPFVVFYLHHKNTSILKTLLSCVPIILISMVVFLSINYEILFHIENFFNGIGFEFKHSINGHSLYIPFGVDPFFHWKNDILYSTNLGYFILLGTFFAATKFNSSRNVKLLFLLTLTFYIVIEISPLKPSPGYIRYAIPPVTLGTLLSIYLFHKISKNKKIKILVYGVTCTLALLAFWDSYQLIEDIPEDARVELMEKKKYTSTNALFDSYAAPFNGTQNTLDIKEFMTKDNNDSIKYLILCSFNYERYLRGLNYPDQSKDIYEIGNYYKSLLSKKNVETIKSPHKPIGFFFPEINVVTLK